MRQCLLSNGFLLSNEEVFSLEERYNDDVGFNYFWFLKEVDPKPCEEQLVDDLKCILRKIFKLFFSFQYANFLKISQKLNEPKPPKPPSRHEKDIIQILAKIKGKVVRERIRVIEFLQPYDKCNEMVISWENFVRGLSVCQFDLTEVEVETLMEV